MADITTSITGAEFRDEINRELMAYDESVMMQPIYYYNHNVKQILTFESTGDAGVTFTGGAYNTTYYKVGSSSRGFTNLAGTQIMTVSWASNINLATFNNGMVSATSDFINIVVYIGNTIPSSINIEFSTNNNGSSVDVEELQYVIPASSLISGYNFLSIAKSSFSGLANWNNIGYLRLFYTGGDATTDVYYDCLHMQRKDPSVNVANLFQRQINGAWTADFLLDGGYWFIGYENNELIMRDIKAGGGYRLAYSVKTFQDFNMFATMKVNSANQATGIAWYYNAGNVIRVGIDGNTLYIKTLENSIDSTISIPMATSPGDIITFYFIKNKSTITVIAYNARTGNKLSISKETTILYTNFGTVGIYHSLNNPTTVYNFGVSKLLYVPNSGNADTVGGKLANNTANNLAIYDNNGRVLDSDKVDGYNAGNSSGQVPISNGTVCTNLNSDMVDGYHANDTSSNIPIYNANKIISGGATTANGIIETGIGSLTVYKKVVSIGDWNMDSTGSISVVHGLGSSWNKVISIQVMIITDMATSLDPLTRSDGLSDPNLLAGGVYNIDNTDITLTRRAGGVFDSTSYDSTSFNRGYVYIEYTS